MRKKGKAKQVNYIAILIAIFIFIVSVVLMLQSTNIVENVLYSYNTNSKIDYKVYIYSNDYIKSEYMEKGETYISDLVEKINIDYNYSLESSKKLDSNYKYDIISKIVVKHNSTGKELWSEDIVLVNSKNVEKVDNKQLKITENVDVAFKTINDKVKSFKLQFNIPILAYMDVNLSIKDSNTNEEIDSTGVSMNLNEDTFEITENSVGNNIKNIVEETKTNNKVLYIEAGFALVSAIYVIFTIYNAINTTFVKKSYYSKAIYKILKNYGDIVAELVKPVDLSGLKVIDVKNFDQMLDVEEELRIPIMFYETIKNEEGHFVLVHQDMAYRYILRDKFKK